MYENRRNTGHAFQEKFPNKLCLGLKNQNKQEFKNSYLL